MPDPSGTFCNLTDINNVFGTSNVVQYSNLDNSSTALNPARVQAAIDYADQRIQFVFGRSNVNIVAMAGNAYVRNWGSKIAGVWLYQSRGYLDNDNDGNQYSAMIQQVGREMSAVAAGRQVLPNTAFNWPAPSGAIGGTWSGN